MEPAFYKGDVLFLHMGRKPFRAGEVVMFNLEGRDIPIVHRIIKVHEHTESEDILILTKVCRSRLWPVTCLSLYLFHCLCHEKVLCHTRVMGQRHWHQMTCARPVACHGIAMQHLQARSTSTLCCCRVTTILRTTGFSITMGRSGCMEVISLAEYGGEQLV